MYDYNAVVTNVVDGDTFDMDIDLGFHIHIHERARVLGLDTPEKKGNEKKLGLVMMDYANKCLLGKDVVIHSKEELTPTTDSFGRWLVDVELSDGNTWTNLLTEFGVNKYESNYSEENVLKLESELNKYK